MRLTRKTVATALRKSRLHEPFFCSRYGFSPYQGCSHGCLYCDGRAEKYYVEGEFDTDIVVRHNIPQLLSEELAKLREPGVLAIGSGVSDVYQPVEVDLKLTRACAEVIAASGLPVMLATKSSLVERDIDIWSDIAVRSGFTLLMTVVTTRDDLRAETEPYGSSIQSRFRTLARFKRRGAATGLLAMPLLPGLSDSTEDIRNLYRAAADAGVDCVIPGNLTLRPGRQKDLFEAYIDKSHRQLKRLYERLYAENRPSGNTIVEYRRSLDPFLSQISRELGIPGQIPHRCFKGRIPAPDEVHLLLRHMLELYRRMPGADRLQKSVERYRRWLDQTRRYFNRRRSLEAGWVAEEFHRALAEEDERESLFANQKLTEFIRTVVNEGKTLDYPSLALR